MKRVLYRPPIAQQSHPVVATPHKLSDEMSESAKWLVDFGSGSPLTPSIGLIMQHVHCSLSCDVRMLGDLLAYK